MENIIGRKAIELAEIYAEKGHTITLHKFADPTEGEREGLSISEAREIAREDASLIYIPAKKAAALQMVEDAPWDEFDSALTGRTIFGRSYFGPLNDKTSFRYKTAVEFVEAQEY